MLKIAVVEDQQEVRDELCRFIRQYAAENSLQVEVLPIEDGAVIAEHYERGMTSSLWMWRCRDWTASARRRRYGPWTQTPCWCS